MRYAFEAAQRRADDRAQRLEAHIERRLQEPFPRPEQAAAAKLRGLHPGEIAAVVLENLPRAISEKADWWRACEILADGLGFADGLGAEPRLRIGNLALNFATDALPDLYQIDYEADHAPRVTPGAEHRLLAARPATVVRAHEPLTEAPPAWDRPQVDGHFFVRAVHSETREAVRATFEDGSIEPVARAVSALQSVPLMINPEVLDCLRHYDEFGGCGIKHIPPKEAPSHRNSSWQRQLQARHQALRVRFDRNIDTATRLLGRPIYIRLRCDWRGRIASITDLHFGREDTIRGVLMFARSKPIGEAGLRRLKIQVATCAGFDGINRASEDERAPWCDDPKNLAMVRMIARLPKWRLSQRWLREAKEPIQLLAACRELIAALEVGPTFESRLPCTIDATASGYQHLTLMRGATEEAALVNLVPDKPPQDFYGRVADELRALLQKEYSVTERKVDPVSESEIFIVNDEDDSSDEAAERGLFADWALRELDINRDLVKSNTMTKVYGADERGSMSKKNFERLEDLMGAELPDDKKVEISRDDLETRLRWKRPVGKYIWDKYQRRAQRLAGYVDAVIQKLMPRAYETMGRLQKLAVALGREKKFVSWQTPSGFPFRNCYRNPVEKRPRFIIGKKPRQKKVIVGWGNPRLSGQSSVKSGVVANVVHACDASHLMRTVNAANRAGIYDIVSVHDSLGCHAADVERFRGIILDQLMQMHERHDVLGEIWNAGRAATNAPLPAQLEREAFNWRGLLKAKNAFS